MSSRAFAIYMSLLCAGTAVAPGPRALAPLPSASDLEPHTLRAFERYAALTRTRVLSQARASGNFLYIDYLPPRRRAEISADLRDGDMYMEPLETRGPDGERLEIEDGLVHHWLGAVFVPGVGLDRTLDLIQDYDRHSEIYGPAVEAAHIIERDGGHFQVFMRFRKKKVITVVMDTIHDVEYVHPGADRTYSISRTTSVREVQDPGTVGEQALPDGEGSGFLWRINSYWRFIERDGGTYIECESISLTRTIPLMLRWLVGPFVNDVPREQLAELLQTTRRALVEN